VSDSSDDLLAPEAPETEPSPADLEDDADDDPGLSAEESLGFLPPD
jgi:hypothetical protein